MKYVLQLAANLCWSI